jgi:predicted O-methyltransferase YrrM
MLQVAHFFHTIFGWFDFPDVYDEALRRTPEGGILVEVGVWKGKSFSYLLVEAANSGKNLRLIGVDHFQGSAGQHLMLVEARFRDLEAECRTSLSRASYPFELLRLPSVEAAAQFPDASLDFVFIDGSHDEDSVCEDIRAWLPKVKPGGVLAGHDFDTRTDPGVVRAVSRLLPGHRVVGRCWWYDCRGG